MRCKSSATKKTSPTPEANVDAAVAPPAEAAGDANPNHLTDFTRLVDVAARKKPKD